MSAVITVHHYIGGSCQCNKTRERKGRCKYWKGRTKIIITCVWPSYLLILVLSLWLGYILVGVYVCVCASPYTYICR